MSAHVQGNYLRKISRRKAKSSTKQSSLRIQLGHEAQYSNSVGSRQPRSTVLLNRKKQSPATQHPEMVAPDYDPSELERSITPIVQELTKIKERVTEVCA